MGASGQPIVGAIPLRIQILDALGRSTEFSRYGATAADGCGLTIPITPALNDDAGNWTIRVTESLGNTQAEQEMSVR